MEVKSVHATSVFRDHNLPPPTPRPPTRLLHGSPTPPHLDTVTANELSEAGGANTENHFDLDLLIHTVLWPPYMYM